MSGICPPCGRPAGVSCDACLSGNPPPEKVAHDRMQARKHVSDQVMRARRHLAEIPELVIEASYYLTPGSAPLDPMFSSGGKGTVYKIPIVPEIFDLLDDNDKALDDVMLNRSGTSVWFDGKGRKVVDSGLRRTGVLPTLGMWVSLAYAELEDLGRDPRECCPAREHTVSGEAGWLSEYAADIIELHPEFPRDIQLLWQELQRACRIRREYVPSCPECSTDRHRNYLEGIYGTDDDHPAWWRCNACGYTSVRDAEIRRMAALQPRMTLRQIADLLRLPITTLRGWRDQNRFQPDSQGKYELEHVKRAAQRVGRIPEESAITA